MANESRSSDVLMRRVALVIRTVTFVAPTAMWPYALAGPYRPKWLMPDGYYRQEWADRPDG